MKISCNVFGHKFVKNTGNDVRYYTKYICKRCKTTAEYESEIWEDTFWKSDTWENIKVISIGIGVIAGVLLVLFGILGGIMSIQSYFTCTQYKDMGIDVIWKLWTGCMANHPKFGYIPIEEYFKTLNLYKP